MATTIEIAAPNCLLFLGDADDRSMPEITGDGSVWTTPSCVAFGCYPFMDGETEVTLGHEGEIQPKGNLVFEGTLETPRRSIDLLTSERNVLIRTPVPGTKVQIRIWANHPAAPDKVFVAWREDAPTI